MIIIIDLLLLVLPATSPNNVRFSKFFQWSTHQ